MNNIECKAFILQKDGSPVSCQDRFGMNLRWGRFVVADGVSNSYCPEVTARELCWLFTQADFAADDWPRTFRERLAGRLSDTWQREVAAYEALLTGRQLRHALDKREDLPPGATTMAGIVVDLQHRLFCFHILGDSTLFIVPEGHEAEWFCTTEARLLEDGRRRVLYNNRPGCLVADGRMAGTWLHGVQPLRKGFIALATDGLAEWIQDELLAGHDAMSQLWALQDHDDFEALAAEQRRRLLMEDDLALIILRIIDDAPADGFRLLYEDEQPSPFIAKPANRTSAKDSNA